MDATFEPPAKHHKKHWSSFGNVVLVGAVESWQSNTILFRVHSAILSERSEVFASMFAFPQGEGGDQKETYDGLPLVRLPDTSKQVCAMLDAIRDPLKFSERTVISDTPIRIRDALYMASKYLMADLRTKLVKILESEWPLTAVELEIKDQFLHDFLKEEGKAIRKDAKLSIGWPIHFVPEPAAAIWVAEEFDIRSILPAAYYDILRCSPRVDWDSYDWFSDDPPPPSEKPARWDVLSRKSLRIMHRLQDFLAEKTNDQFFALSQYKSPYCILTAPGETHSTPCRGPWAKSLEEHRTIPARLQDRDLLMQFRTLRASLASTEMCGLCQEWYAAEL